MPLPIPAGAAGGPGAVTIDGLSPGTSYDLTVSAPGLPRRLVERFTTLRPPPGRRVDAFATVNDVHLAEPGFGLDYRRLIEEPWPLPEGREPYTWRCLTSAMAEAEAWGARALVVKGDMIAHGDAAEFREIGAVLCRSPVPVMAIYGNHEYHHPRTDGRRILAEHGLLVPREPWAEDLKGVRLVFALSARAGQRSGVIDTRQRERLVALAAAAPGPALVLMHHQPQRSSWPTEYPPGVSGRQARPFLDELQAANPATFVASGHTHRHRRRRDGTVEVVEVGSPKDYPGTWTGYAIHEGGIRQVVRRIEDPTVIAWTESTARAVRGLWGRWSPGRRDDRCFTHVWPPR